MWCSFNRFEFQMTKKQAAQCSHSGDCLPDVKEVHPKIKLSHISDEALKAELKEYGAWDDEELNDRKENEKRIIWIGAGNIMEGK